VSVLDPKMSASTRVALASAVCPADPNAGVTVTYSFPERMISHISD
jgi:hypothetical protein